MDRLFLVNLTNNLYRLTLLFPKKEPLRYKIRELADDILADLIKEQTVEESWSERIWLDNNKIRENLIKNLEILESFLEVAKAQNWVPFIEILRIQEEYKRIKIEIKKIIKHSFQASQGLGEVRSRQTQEFGGAEEKFFSGRINQILNLRQEKILTFLKEQGQVQVWQVKQIFPEVTKRTIRRDFAYLLKKGLIERIGEGNNTFYQLKIGQNSTRT